MRVAPWSFLPVSTALAAPLAVAVAGTHGIAGPAWQAVSVAAIALTVVAVYAFSMGVEGCSLRRLGFAATSGWSIPIGLLLAGFFIGGFGPLATAALARLGTGGFETGTGRLADLPVWLLVVTIMVVGAAEELLYRAYAIERLGALTGSRRGAGLMSLAMASLAHVPLWGWAPALTTAVSGAVFTIVYLVRADVVALIIAHVATDVFGLVIAPHLAR